MIETWKKNSTYLEYQYQLSMDKTHHVIEQNRERYKINFWSKHTAQLVYKVL